MFCVGSLQALVVICNNICVICNVICVYTGKIYCTSLTYRVAPVGWVMVLFYLWGDENTALSDGAIKGPKQPTVLQIPLLTRRAHISCVVTHSSIEKTFKMLPATFKLCAGISYRHTRNMTGKELIQESTVLWNICNICHYLFRFLCVYLPFYYNQVWGRTQWLQSIMSWTSFPDLDLVPGSSRSEEGARFSVRGLLHHLNIHFKERETVLTSTVHVIAIYCEMV